MHRLLFTLSALAALLLPAGAHASNDDDLRFGPPWISVEYPANPHHPSTRNATFMIRAYHHTDAIRPAMTAVAEGLVSGQRQTVQIEVTATHIPGVYAVTCDLPKDGAWIVAVTLEQSPGSTATALVTMNDGRVGGAEVPSTRTPDGWVVPREVNAQDIDARLRTLANAEEPGRTRYAGAGLAGLLALALALGARRRRS